MAHRWRDRDEHLRIWVGVLGSTGIGMLMWAAAITLAHYMR